MRGDRAQSRRMVARVLGTRPEWLSKRRRRALSSRSLIRLRIAASSNADVLEPDGDRLAVRNYFYPYARVIVRALAARVAEEFRVKFAPDAPVEQAGFELSVLFASMLAVFCATSIGDWVGTTRCSSCFAASYQPLALSGSKAAVSGFLQYHYRRDCALSAAQPLHGVSDATYQEELLRSIRNPNPPRTEKIDPQHELGIVQADFGHIDFRIADNLAVDTTHGHCRIARQDRFAHAQRQCSSRREHGELRAGIEQSADPAAIELHRKVQAVARRSTRRDPNIRLGPGRRGSRAALPLIQGHTAPRQVEIDIEAPQGVSSEHSIQRPGQGVHDFDRRYPNSPARHFDAADREAAQLQFR